ncbi:MAG: hypothetical protein ABIG64_09560 [Candidatus Omnitrophota bacterium]
MKRVIEFTVILLIICTSLGCAEKKDRLILKNGLSSALIIESWGQPTEKIKAGLTKKNYPVEVWEYTEKKETTMLIFVDQELYAWSINDPEFILKELAQLDILEKKSEYLLTPSKEFLDRQTNIDEQNRRTMETIKTYQLFKETQQQIQNQQIMQTIRQQQLRPPVQPVEPIRPIHRQY